MNRAGVSRVFVYGTLMPGHVRWPLLAGFACGSPRKARVDGRLYDTGRGYPAAFLDERGTVPGLVVALDPGCLASALAHLDQIEGVGSGLFLRELIVVDGAPAWIYVGSDRTPRKRAIARWA